MSAAVAVWSRAALLWLCGLWLAVGVGVVLRLDWWLAAVLFGFVSLGGAAVLVWLIVFVLLVQRAVRAAKLRAAR